MGKTKTANVWSICRLNASFKVIRGTDMFGVGVERLGGPCQLCIKIHAKSVFIIKYQSKIEFI